MQLRAQPLSHGALHWHQVEAMPLQRCHLRTSTRTVSASTHQSGSIDKTVWVQTHSKAVLTAALECGLTECFLFDSRAIRLLDEWKQLATFTAFVQSEDGAVLEAGSDRQARMYVSMHRPCRYDAECTVSDVKASYMLR